MLRSSDNSVVRVASLVPRQAYFEPARGRPQENTMNILLNDALSGEKSAV